MTASCSVRGLPVGGSWLDFDSQWTFWSRQLGGRRICFTMSHWMTSRRAQLSQTLGPRGNSQKFVAESVLLARHETVWMSTVSVPWNTWALGFSSGLSSSLVLPRPFPGVQLFPAKRAVLLWFCQFLFLCVKQRYNLGRAWRTVFPSLLKDNPPVCWSCEHLARVGVRQAAALPRQCICERIRVFSGELWARERNMGWTQTFQQFHWSWPLFSGYVTQWEY